MMTDAEKKRAQQARALVLANEVRIARSKVRIGLKEGQITMEDILRDPPSCIVALPVSKVLVWGPRIGPRKMLQILRGTPEVGDINVRLCYLNESRREAIIARLNGYSGRSIDA